MNEQDNYTLADRVIEFSIMAILVVGIALPVIAISLYDIFSIVNFAHAMDTTALLGNY